MEPILYILSPLSGASRGFAELVRARCDRGLANGCRPVKVSIRHHTSAIVSIRQHTSAYGIHITPGEWVEASERAGGGVTVC